jgi:plasmid replication initiation protein
VGQREVSVEWLRDAFQLENKYPAIKDFKKRVIEPAVEQINELSPLWAKWNQRKTGRRVSHLMFTFGEKAPEKPQKPCKKKPTNTIKSASGARFGIPQVVIEANALPGESYEDAALRLLHEAKAKRTINK